MNNIKIIGNMFKSSKNKMQMYNSTIKKIIIASKKLNHWNNMEYLTGKEDKSTFIDCSYCCKVTKHGQQPININFSFAQSD